VSKHNIEKVAFTFGVVLYEKYHEFFHVACGGLPCQVQTIRSSFHRCLQRSV